MTLPIALAFAAAAATPPAATESATANPTPTELEPSEPDGADGRFEGAQLPPALMPGDSSHFLLGVAVEEYGRGTDSRDELYGLAGMLRFRTWGPHALLMLKPGGDSYEDTRFLAGVGLRSYLPLFGLHFSYGVGMHVEARLQDHFWLASATPLELGAVLFAKGSWQLELLVGARRAFAGELINSFVLDPNGFDNEDASDALYRTKTLDPWQGFIRLVFARRLD